MLLRAGNYQLTVADYEYIKNRQKEPPKNSGLKDQLKEAQYPIKEDRLEEYEQNGNDEEKK